MLCEQLLPTLPVYHESLLTGQVGMSSKPVLGSHYFSPPL